MTQSKPKTFRIKRGFPLLARVLFGTLSIIYRIRASVPDEVREIKGPILFLGNHNGAYDPFIMYNFLRKPVLFVISEGVLRDSAMRWLLNGFGVIPKKKNVRDTQVIRNMVQAIRNGDGIGLFPEGNRSWTGSTHYMEPSLAKLVKMLNVPVVVATAKGMQLFNPRWGTRFRFTKVQIDYQLVFDKQAITKAGDDEILGKIWQAMKHDEVAWQQDVRNKIYSNHRAEHIGFVLFLCPECKSIGQISSHHNHFGCSKCGMEVYINRLGFFEGKSGKEIQFDNIRDWYDWQWVEFKDVVQFAFRERNQQVLFLDLVMIVFQQKGEDMKNMGSAKLHFYIDRIEILFEAGGELVFELNEIESISTELKERLEISYAGISYRIVGKKPGKSALKYEMAANAIWELTGLEQKLSTYLKPVPESFG
jgi:1-acyl-sn-glycerol-3-phosphate acyltransferase